MLISEYNHNIDEKGRLFIPAKLRSVLGTSFIVTRSVDHCISVYSLEEWKNIEEKIRVLPSSKSREIQRFLFASASELTADKNGRVVIPQNLREYAFLTKEVVIAGAGSKAEIWDKERWDKMQAKLSPEDIAATMDELGF